ncbi:hypothetical protein M407DRAFT_38982, partial [Tulasnella calospora MUT 4182]
YAADETGIALGQAMRTLVIGPAGQNVQHKQQDVEREIVTVLETICADGTYLRPTVIFKVGPNGYMDTELALKWLEDFNDQTKEKNDLPRVLVLDGHASHTGRAFLDRAEELGIHVVSYPPHTTHALQGLDVVVFASLKRHWQAVHDARERETGLPIQKEDFILLYSAAHTATLTPQIITEAFRKTGLYPVNRGAVSAEQMAPSTESARYAAFPADLASPVKAVLAAN